MKSRPHSSTRRVSRHHFLFNLVQATLGEPRLVGRTSAVCKTGTPLRPTPPPHLKPGHRSPAVSHSAPYRGRRHARNRRSQITPGISLRDLNTLSRAYAKSLSVVEEDIALEKSIAGAVLLEEVTHTPSPEWKVVDEIAVEFLESQTKPEWKGGELDVLGFKKNALLGMTESKIPSITKQIPKSTSSPLIPSSIPLFTVPTIPISAQVQTQIPAPVVVPAPVQVPSTKLKLPSKGTKGAAKSDDTVDSATTPRSTKSTAGKKGAAAAKDNASKADGNTGPNAKGAAGKKGVAATADAKGGSKKGSAAKPLVGAKNADKPAKNPSKTAPTKDAVERKPAAKGGAKKPNPASAPAKNAGRPKSPPAGGKKVSFKGPADPPARGRGGPAPRSSRSTMSGGGGGPTLKASKSTPAGKGDISIEKYTQQIIKLKKTLQENSSIVTILEKQLMLDSQGKPQSEADVLLREQVVRLDMDLQCAKTRMKELEDMYVSEKLARERDCRTIKMLEAARDELQKVVAALQQQEKAMKEAYESKVGVLTTTVTGLQMAQQEQNRLRFEEARSQFSFIPQNTVTSPRSSFSTVQPPKPLVIPAPFTLAQPIPFTPGPGATFGYTPTSPTSASKPASLPSSPVAPASASALPGQNMAAVGATDDDNLPTDINARCLVLESRLKEAQEALNKEWKERVELEEKYNLEKKERTEIEQLLVHERKERIALEEKSKLDQFNKTQLEARLAIVERDLANYRKVPETPQPIQWPPSPVGVPKPSPTPSLIKTGGSGVGGFHSIKMRLAEAGIQ